MCEMEKRERGKRENYVSILTQSSIGYDFKMRDDKFEQVICDTIGAMIEVHKQLGPRFFENVYHRASAI